MLKILLAVSALGLALVLLAALEHKRPALDASSTLLSLDLRTAVAEAQSEIDTLKVRRCKESSRPLADTLSKWASTPERRLQRVGRRVSLGPQNASTKHFLDAGTPFDLESRATEG